MKRKSVLTIAFFTILLSLFSCKVNKQYIQYISKKEDIKTLETKKVILFTTDNVSVNEFTKTFEKNFAKKEDFTLDLMTEFTKKGLKNNLFSDISIDSISNTYDDLYTKNSDYVISLSSVEVTNRVEWDSSVNIGTNGMNSSTSTEYCVINIKVEVYDAKNGKEILDFVAIGEESVLLFNYRRTFQEAKDNVINHIINYLKSGKTDYKEY